MRNIKKTISTFIDISHIEYQTYDVVHGKMIYSSGLAHKVLGYSEQEVLKLSHNFYEILIHPDDLNASKKTVDKILKSSAGEIIENTSRFKKSDGSYCWIYTRQTVLERDIQGNPSIICTIAEDITEFIKVQKQLEEKIKQLKVISWKNSHLVRGPVASIIGCVNLIEEKEISSPHNLKIFRYIKETIEILDLVIHEINDDANK